MTPEEVFSHRPIWSAERFWARVNKRADGGCWIWTGSGNSGTGYGEVIIDWHKTGAHRVAYMLTVGPIPEGLEIDHLCRVRRCVNPAHLEAVTKRENVLRGVSLAASRARITHCPHGHEYTPENTYVSARNQRSCRECGRENSRRRYREVYRFTQPWKEQRARRAAVCTEVDEAHWSIMLPGRRL